MNKEHSFNIIWLDDKIEEYQKEYRQGYKDPFKENPSELNFTFIKFKDVFREEFSAFSHKYHAVILDANGIDRQSPADEPDKNGFSDLIDLVAEKEVLLYIFSGELERQEYNGKDQDYLNSIIKRIGGKDHFYKKSGGPERLFNKIIDDLDSKYHYYIGHEYLIDLFSKGWIDEKYRSAQLDPIMEYYKNHNIDSAYGNQMRILFEQMLEKVNSILPCTEVKQDRASKIIEGLKSQYKRYVIAMIGALKHMDEMPNELSHNTLAAEERELHFNSDYSTFFLVAHWFYNLMLQFEKEGVLPSKKTSPSNSPRPESNYDGLYEYPFEENGIKYVKLKVKVSYGNKELIRKEGAVLVTGIRIDWNNPQKWITFPVNDVRVIDEKPKSTGFKLSDTAIFKKWK